MARLRKTLPTKRNYNTYSAVSTKAEAIKDASSLEKTKCGVIVVKPDNPIKSQRGKVIRYYVMYPANQIKCKK